ncbi:MAG: hypothetical protein AB7T10_03340 [bacterium]
MNGLTLKCEKNTKITITIAGYAYPEERFSFDSEWLTVHVDVDEKGSCIRKTDPALQTNELCELVEFFDNALNEKKSRDYKAFIEPCLFFRYLGKDEKGLFHFSIYLDYELKPSRTPMTYRRKFALTKKEIKGVIENLKYQYKKFPFLAPDTILISSKNFIFQRYERVSRNNYMDWLKEMYLLSNKKMDGEIIKNLSENELEKRAVSEGWIIIKLDRVEEQWVITFKEMNERTAHFIRSFAERNRDSLMRNAFYENTIELRSSVSYENRFLLSIEVLETENFKLNPEKYPLIS